MNAHGGSSEVSHSPRTTGSNAAVSQDAGDARRRSPREMETDDEKFRRERYEEGLWPGDIVSW